VYERVANFIREHNLFVRDIPVVVGVSGGADSVCLLDCLVHLGYSLVVAHLDHQLRPESAAEASFVRQISETYDLPFASQTLQLGADGEAAGSLEERARLARYQFLLTVAIENNAQGVAVGHTVDDQIETVLMHLMRGAGPEGLSGMEPRTRFSDWAGIDSKKPMDLMRPLLVLTRADTEQHCDRIGVKPVEDASNLDNTFFRNRIRNELLPLLETYNPGIRSVLQRLSEVMQEQVNFNDAAVEEAWPDIVLEQGEGGMILDVAAMRGLHPFLQRLLVRRLLEDLAPELRDISHAATLRGVAWFENEGRQASMILPGGVTLERYGEDALLRYPDGTVEFPAYPQLENAQDIQLDPPCIIPLAAGWSLAAEFTQSSSEVAEHCLEDPTHREAVFPAQIAKEGLFLRPRKPGDRMRLPAVEGRTKISDLMINRKIPVQTRELWPIIATKSEVLWVPYLQRSVLHQIDLEEQDFLRLSILSP
jgi:tRNA(Ile)-lysidine synthase